MKRHILKCDKRPFQAFIDGKKTSDIRTMKDRDYQIGDTVTLQEGQLDLEKGFDYTGREWSARITWIDDYGCDCGFVNLSYGERDLLII